MLYGQIKIANQTAVIVKGNPAYINNNPEADRFYNDLGSFMKSQHYDVSYDPGLPHTEPRKANVWLGHSRGADRLRWAPNGVNTIALGAQGGINHPKDRAFMAGQVPNKYHFQLTDEMKQMILNRLR